MGESLTKNNKLTFNVIAMFTIMVVSKVLGFLRDILLAYKFGTSDIADAYTVAITLPSILFAVFVSGLNQSYIPYYTRIGSLKKKQEFFSNTLIIYIILSLVATMISFVFRNSIASLLAPGFDPARHDICSSFVGIIIWMFPFYIVLSLMSAQLQTQEDFIFSNFCDFIVVNLVVIISIYLATPESKSVLAVGYTLSMVLASALLCVYFVKKADIRFDPVREGALSQFKELMVIAIPVGLSYMVNQLNSMTDSIFSSMFDSGVTSGLNYANKIQSIFLTMTTIVFMSAVFPRLNVHFAKNEYDEGIYYIRKGILLSSWLAIPFAAFIGVYSKDIVIAVFQRGAFVESSTLITAGCLGMYAFGIPFYSYAEIGSRTLTASMKQKLILKDTCIAVGFNIIADYVLMKMIGYIGLSLATSISGIVLLLLYYRDIKKSGLKCIDKEIRIGVVKVIAATVLSIGASAAVRVYFLKGMNDLLVLLITTAVFGIVYIIACVGLGLSLRKQVFNIS